MLGHVPDQDRVRLVPGQAELPKRRVTPPQDLPRFHSELGEHVSEFDLVERFAAIVAVAEFDVMLPQQGDRLATGASGAGADEIEHGRSVR